MIPIEIQSLYECRILIFLEESPQSNRYRQVVLDPAQFVAMNQTLRSCFSEKIIDENKHLAEIIITPKPYLFPDLPSHYL